MENVLTKAQPTVTKRVSRRKKTEVKLTPTTIKGVPEPPSWLHPIAKTHWCEVCSELDHLGILATADIWALQTLCQTFKAWAEAEQYLNENGMSYSTVTREGVEIRKAHPEVAVSRECRTSLLQQYKTFGLNPGARATIGLEMGRDKNASNPIADKHFG